MRPDPGFICPTAAGDLPSHHANCLGCGPGDLHGHRCTSGATGDHVRARHVFDDRHIGAPGIAHDGAVATVLDDLLGFLFYLVGGPAVTRDLHVSHRAPAPLGEAYLLAGRLDRRAGRKLFLSAVGADRRGETAVSAQAVSVVVSSAHFTRRERDAPPAP